MKLNRPDLPRKAQCPLLIACATYPLAVLLTLGLAREAIERVWVFPAVYLALALVCLALPGKVRLAGGVAGCVALLGVGVALMPFREQAGILLLPAGYAVVLMLGLSMAAWPREQELSLLWIVLGLVAHVLAQIMLNSVRANADRPGAYVELMLVAPELFGSFLILLGLAMLSANRSSVHSASMGRQRIPVGMRRWNTLLTAGLMGGVLLITAIPGLARALYALWDAIRMGVGALMRLLSSLLPQGNELPGERGSAAPDMFGMMEETAEPSAFLLVVEQVLRVLLLAALAVLAVFVVRFLYRRLKVLVRRLLDHLSRFAAAAGEDYVDEITDTRDEEGTERQSLRGRFRQRMSWNRGNLSPRERIRYRYQRLQHRHPEWHGSRTAREAIPCDAAGLYERARYSDHEVTEADARAFEEGVRKI